MSDVLRVVLAAAWARSEYDTDEDLAMEDPGVPFYTGILVTGPPLSVGSRSRRSATAAGNAHLAIWGLCDRDIPTTDSWERVSGLIWQAASDWSSNALLRYLALRTIVARAELEGLVVFLDVPLLSSLETFLVVLAACGIPRGEAIGKFSLEIPFAADCMLPRVPVNNNRKVR